MLNITINDESLGDKREKEKERNSASAKQAQKREREKEKEKMVKMKTSKDLLYSIISFKPLSLLKLSLCSSFFSLFHFPFPFLLFFQNFSSKTIKVIMKIVHAWFHLLASFSNLSFSPLWYCTWLINQRNQRPFRKP